MKKVVGVIALPVELDEHLAADWDVGNAELRPEQLHDRLCVGDGDFVALDQPIRDRGIVGSRAHLFLQLRAQLADGTRQSRGQGHLGGIPARDGWEMSVRALNVCLLNPSVDQSNGAAAQYEQVADLELLDEIFLDRT